MSTTLQNYWSSDHSYAISLLEDPNRQIEDVIIEHNGDRQALQQLIGSSSITFDVKNDKVNIFSSEGVSNAFNGRPGYARFQSVKQELFASILSKRSETLFFVVRDPVRWVRSIYAQHLREGGTLDLADYLDEHRGFLLETLNLDKTLATWARDGFEILVLPLELASRMEEFWGLYEKYLGIPRPKKQPDVVLSQTAENRTLYERLPAQKVLNGAMSLLIDGAQNEPLTPDQMNSTMNLMRVLGTRTGVDNMTDEQFARLCRLINPELLVGEDVLFDVDLIEAFIGRHTDKYFLPAARDFCPPECRDIVENYSVKPAK